MVTIDPELQSWILPLKQEEYVQLEKSILEDGCRDALVVWNDTIIDGHNRYAICMAHNIPFQTVEKSFESKNAAKLWMIRNQWARRNLTPFEAGELGLKAKPLIAEENMLRMLAGVSPDNPTQTFVEGTRSDRETLGQIAAESGVSRETLRKIEHIQTAQETGRIAPEVIAALNDKKSKVSISKVFSDIRREEKKVERQADIVLNPVIPDGEYNVILADPPWQYNFSETQSREIENQYPTMTLDDIKNLNLPVEENSVLFLWATAPKLEEALEVLNAWGYEYKTCAIWDKGVIGMGYWFRSQHELLLVGVMGTFRTPEAEDRFSSMIHSHRSTHSSKPEIIYEMLEKMFPNKKYLEVFARSNREGWVSWGNQV